MLDIPNLKVTMHGNIGDNEENVDCRYFHHVDNVDVIVNNVDVNVYVYVYIYKSCN